MNSKIVKNDSGSYDMDNVTSSNLPPFNMKAGVSGKFNLQILCSYYSIIAVYSIGKKSYYGIMEFASSMVVRLHLEPTTQEFTSFLLEVMAAPRNYI